MDTSGNKFATKRNTTPNESKAHAADGEVKSDTLIPEVGADYRRRKVFLGGNVTKLRIYPLGKRLQAFRGKGKNANTWYVYDTHENRYVGGSFTTLTAATEWADAQ